MFRKPIPFFLGGLLLLGLALLTGYFLRPITISDDSGENKQIRVLARTVAQVLYSAGVALAPADQVEPALNQPVPLNGQIRIRRAVDVFAWEDGQMRAISDLERAPAALLALNGIHLAEGDRLLRNGQPLDLNLPLPTGQPIVFQIERAHSVMISEGEKNQTRLINTGQTVASAVWDAGIRPGPGDQLSPPVNQLIDADTRITYQPAQPLTIQVSGQGLRARSAAVTVGRALAEAGLALQGLDFAQPAADQPLPADGKIRVVRVCEEIVLQETLIPFGSKVEPDPNVDLDQRKVTRPGQLGVNVVRERVRYEDGQEISRVVDSDWSASQPVDQIVGVGTRIVPLKLDIPGGQIEYYRAVPVYATSYSPCNQGIPRCSWSTASGIRLTKGIIAVRGSWYRQLAGHTVYIPGYGTAVIGDVGGGLPDRYWIDLGFDEEIFEDQKFVGWTTLYFLTPAPANVPWSLP